LLIEEAGGRITDYRGARLDIYTPKVLATNGHVHDAMMGVLNS
jgi:myo-inositol-1(or 4)-monophosphatase